MLKRILVLLAISVLPVTSQATLVDFTDISWQSAISGSTASLGGVSLSATDGNLTFNAGDNGGCVAGKTAGIHNLACAGDGIGVNNDEISEGLRGDQSITVTFDTAVDINNIYLLDLFGNESSGGFINYDIGEKAVINGMTYWSFGAVDNIGGFFTTNFSDNGITSILFEGYNDYFSDYALAAIDYDVSVVPLPGAVFLFGTALLGFMGFNRFNK